MTELVEGPMEPEDCPHSEDLPRPVSWEGTVLSSWSNDPLTREKSKQSSASDRFCSTF